MTRKTYTATAARDDGWWFLIVPEVKGAYTQARRLDQAEAMVRDVLAMVLAVDEDSFDVEIRPTIVGPSAEVVDHAVGARGSAEAAQHEAREATTEAAEHLHSEGMSVRDIGWILGLSHQRIAKILSGARAT